jgi:hypothetical protein
MEFMMKKIAISMTLIAASFSLSLNCQPNQAAQSCALTLADECPTNVSVAAQGLTPTSCKNNVLKIQVTISVGNSGDTLSAQTVTITAKGPNGQPIVLSDTFLVIALNHSKTYDITVPTAGSYNITTELDDVNAQDGFCVFTCTNVQVKALNCNQPSVQRLLCCCGK